MPDEPRRPTVLMVGQGEPIQGPLGEALRRHSISVACCATVELQSAVRAYAPDLVLLIGDAAVRSGTSVVRAMSKNRATDMLPVAVISNDAVHKDQASHFRTGSVAVIARGAGADTIARRVLELTEEIPQRAGLASGPVSEETLHEVVQLAASDAKTGILSIRAPSGEIPDLSMLVESEAQSAEDLDLMLNKLRSALQSDTELQYEFHEASGGRLSIVPAGSDESLSDLSALKDTRIVALDSDILRAERLSDVLREVGAHAAAAGLALAELSRIREIDPQVIIVDATAVRGDGFDVVRSLRKDPQLQWASILIVRWEELWPARASRPELGKLAARIQPLLDQDQELRRRAVDEIDFDTRLEIVGPGRLIRALGAVPGVRHLVVSSPKAGLEIDIADSTLLGAYATYADQRREPAQGMPALMTLWELNAGRVSVREQDLPSVANIMMPVDETLGLVAQALGGEGDEALTARALTLRPAAEAPAAGGIGRTFQERPTTKTRLAKVNTQQVPASAVEAAREEASRAEPRSTVQEADAVESDVPTAPHRVLRERIEPKAIPVGAGSPPPPPPASKTSGPVPATAGEASPEMRDSAIELARVLEGELTVLPGPAKENRRWVPALAAGVLLASGAIVWTLLQGPQGEPGLEASPQAQGESLQEPLTGPVAGTESARQVDPNTGQAETAADTLEDPSRGEAIAAAAEAPEARQPEVETALEIPTRNLPRNPAQASDVLVHRALPMIRRGELALAEATLDRAWELDPDNPQAMAGYAKLFLAKNDGERALKWARRAATRRRKRSEYQVLLGDALQMVGDIEAARKAWRQALRLDRRNRSARARLAATKPAPDDEQRSETAAVTATASSGTK